MFFTFPHGMENNPFLTFEVTYSEENLRYFPDQMTATCSHILIFFFFPSLTPVVLYILVYI